jgi:tetratricopeptide (TPR) repeat protein
LIASYEKRGKMARMTESRPVIFISAVSKELRSTRDLVAKTLLAMGYEPKWQDIAPTETGDLRAVLRRWVDQSHAVLQIVGHRYGHAPKEPDPTFGPVSYTQYEALYARAKGKKVWYILLDEHHPIDCDDDEPATLKQLQADYRLQVKAHYGLYHSSTALLSTENIVLKLRNDLAKLRRRSKQWAAFILLLMLFLAAGVTWSVFKQKHAGEKLTSIGDLTENAAEKISQQEESIKELKELSQKTYAALLAYPTAVSDGKQTAPEEDEATRTARAYEALEKTLKLPSGTLAKELPALSERLLQRTDTSELDRARAYFAIKQYAEAEAFALRAKDAALAANPVSFQDAIAALKLAGQSASEQIQYQRAIAHYRSAADQTSEKRDLLAWADIQNAIGWLLYLDGQYNAQATLMQRVWQTCKNAGHPEHLTALESRSSWALALNFQGKHAEAEAEHRAVLAIRHRILGPVHQNTLSSRNNLALALDAQGKHAEAETEHRSVLSIMERVLGKEKPDTLMSRMNLANALDAQGKHAEAEAEHRAVLAVKDRVLGQEHPDTLMSRNNLAVALSSQGKHDEAEAQHEIVLAIRKRTLGPEHPLTLMSRNNIADAMHNRGKNAEAVAEHSSVLSIMERVHGPDHPDVFLSCYNFSLPLAKLGRKAEALHYARRALVGWSSVLGKDHPYSKAAKQQVEDLDHK